MNGALPVVGHGSGVALLDGKMSLEMSRMRYVDVHAVQRAEERRQVLDTLRVVGIPLREALGVSRAAREYVHGVAEQAQQ